MPAAHHSHTRGTHQQRRQTRRRRRQRRQKSGRHDDFQLLCNKATNRSGSVVFGQRHRLPKLAVFLRPFARSPKISSILLLDLSVPTVAGLQLQTDFTVWIFLQPLPDLRLREQPQPSILRGHVSRISGSGVPEVTYFRFHPGASGLRL